MMSNMYEYPPPKKPKGSLAMNGSQVFCNNNGKHLGERPLTGHLAEDVWSHLPVSSYDSSKGPTRTPYIPSYMDLSNGPEPCVVCGDAATGYHYRCMTCEGCKGFFRRTIQKNLKYHCKWNGSCIIDKNTRNQCQQCRFTKCLTVGMATDLVLNEKQRIAKRKLIEENRERRRVETMTVGLKHDSCQHDFLTEDDRRLINEIVSAYEHTSVQIPKTYTLPDFNSGNRREGTSPEVWQQLAEIMTPSIVKVVEFAKQVPGFVGLDTSDQILLLKSCCMEIMCLRAACRYSLEEQTLTLQNGLKLKKSQITGGGLGLLVEPIFEFALSLSKLKLDSTEVALLAAVLLMQSDRTGLKIPEAVERLQDAILGAYKRYIAEQRPHQPVHWAKILMKVTDLRTISTRHAERVLCIKLDCPSDIPPLFLEMFDETGAGKAKGRDGEVEAEVSNAVKQLSGEVSGKDSVPYYRPLSNERNTSPVSSESSVSSAGRMSPPQNMVMHNRLTVRRASAAMMSQALSEVRSTQRFSYPTSPSLYTDGMNTPTLPLTPSSLIPPLTPTSPIHIPMSPPGSVPMMNGLISPSVMSRRMSVGALGNLPVPLPISMISAVNSLPVSPPFYSNSVIESSRKSPNAPKSN